MKRGHPALKTHYKNETANITLNWQHMITYPKSKGQKDKVRAVGEFCQELAAKALALTEKDNPFLVIGGDHACAIGTWSGVSHAIKPRGELGLIWIDAHLDAHTPQSSISGNIHGMPVAALLGEGDPRLTTILSPLPKILPHNIIMLGMQSFEPAEKALLEKLGVKVFYMKDLKKHGIESILCDSVAELNTRTHRLGLSIDLDAIDISFAPGVGTPVAKGINLQELLQALTAMPKERLICTEIAEFNPSLDQKHTTEKNSV